MKDALGSVQSVLVLGGASDIARATTRALVERRARTVVLAGRDPDAMHDVELDLKAAGATTVERVHFDADDTASHPELVDDVFGRHGDIDLVLVAFGVLGDQLADEEDVDAALDVLRTNVLGSVSVMLHVRQRFREQGHGTLVVLSSVAAERARRSNFIYGASKAGLDMVADGLGAAVGPEGGRVMIVRPGFVRTKMTAGLRAAPLATTPERVASAIVRGLEREADVVWVPASLRWVMSVLRHLPRMVFRKLPV